MYRKMAKQIYKIAVINYSTDPGPRYSRQGDDSGEDFYHKVLNEAFYKALNANEMLEVSLDGTSGYASSFLDEAFGNLVYDFTLELVQKNLIIISEEEPEWKDMIEKETYVEWEQRRLNKRQPEKSASHEAWYRYVAKDFPKKVWITNLK